MTDQQVNLAGSLSEKFSDLPMLKTIFKSFASTCYSALSNHISNGIEIELHSSMPFQTADYIQHLKNISGSSVLTEYIFQSWNVLPFYTVIQKNILYKIIEVIFGGEKLQHNLETRDRTFSKIEIDVVRTIIDILSNSLQDAFALVASNIKILNQKNYYDKHSIDEIKSDVVFAARLQVHLKGISGSIEVIIPYESLLPIKTQLMKEFSNKKLVQQEDWKHHLRGAMLDMDVHLTVEVEARQTIADIKNLKEGDVIITDKDASEPFDIKINGAKVYDCKIGKLSDNIAVEILAEKTV